MYIGGLCHNGEGGEKQRKCIFRCPRDKWLKDNVGGPTRISERKVSLMITGYFIG